MRKMAKSSLVLRPGLHLQLPSGFNQSLETFSADTKIKHNMSQGRIWCAKHTAAMMAPRRLAGVALEVSK